MKFVPPNISSLVLVNKPFSWSIKILMDWILQKKEKKKKKLRLKHKIPYLTFIYILVVNSCNVLNS